MLDMMGIHPVYNRLGVIGLSLNTRVTDLFF